MQVFVCMRVPVCFCPFAFEMELNVVISLLITLFELCDCRIDFVRF